MAVGQYIYVDGPVETRHSVQFGRVSGIPEDGRRYLIAHFNGVQSYDSDDYIDITKSISQYYSKSAYYVLSAIQSGRKLTQHEWDVCHSWLDGKHVPDVSVAHILGSGLVQNLLNRMILQYRDAEAAFRHQEGPKSARPVEKPARAQKTCARAERKLEKAEAVEQLISPACNDPREILKDAHANVIAVALPVVRSLAMQAAAVARMRGIGRAIIAEEPVVHGYGEQLDDAATSIDKRHLMARDVDVILGNDAKSAPGGRRGRATRRDGAAAAELPLQDKYRIGPPILARDPRRQKAYLSYLRHTVDSPGNLRLGSRKGNSAVGAAFDMPLTDKGQPTERGLRLYEALKTYGVPEMEKCRMREMCGDTYHAGHFTTDTLDRRLSSSMEVSDDLHDQAVEHIRKNWLRSRL